jgi:hypothetical protein
MEARVDGMLGPRHPGDLRGILHVHTSMSDGHAPLKDMSGAKDRGYLLDRELGPQQNAYYAGA